MFVVVDRMTGHLLGIISPDELGYRGNTKIFHRDGLPGCPRRTFESLNDKDHLAFAGRNDVRAKIVVTFGPVNRQAQKPNRPASNICVV